MRVVKELGLRIPEDIAVMGFNDNPRASIVFPQLTTMQLPLQEFGSEAVNLLMNRLNGKVHDRVRKILDTELVVRGSTVKK